MKDHISEYDMCVCRNERPQYGNFPITNQLLQGIDTLSLGQAKHHRHDLLLPFGASKIIHIPQVFIWCVVDVSIKPSGISDGSLELESDSES